MTLFNFAVTTIFAREFLEGAIIIGEYRTIILRGDDDALADGIRRDEALRAVTVSALFATACALVVIAAIAIPLAILSHTFDDSTSKMIEGASKIVAAVCLLQLSLKLPKFLGIYGSCKKKDDKEKEEPGSVDKNLEDEEEEQMGDLEEGLGSAESSQSGMTLRNIRFNVAWNIWREVAECGVFLIPFFLSGDGLEQIPISAAVGSAVGLMLGFGIYYANKQFTDKLALTIFAVLLLVFLSAGLFTGGCHNLEVELGSTSQVWSLDGSFWSVNHLPMTIFKPFGYNDTRTVLQIICYWSWLLLSAVLHYRKYKRAPKVQGEVGEVESIDTPETQSDPKQSSTQQDGESDTVDPSAEVDATAGR